ncbi:MAG: hypothetical protein FJ197_06835 [Gammaproteobacteria bacterium]|nr:hypothetical protein [Gammaproteobacteria bacterium]
MKLTDFPRAVPRAAYSAVINRIVETLVRQPGVRSIFQVGSVTNPGISDIDFFVVFDDGARCEVDPRAGLSTDEIYLVNHGLFGGSIAHFGEVQKFSFLHNYHLLWGEALPIAVSDLPPRDVATLKRQIALEYLVKIYVDSVVEATYGISRVRGFLLHVKGILYDLDFLGAGRCALRDVAEEWVARRDRWFANPPSDTEIRSLLERFDTELPRFIEEQFAAGPFYLPPGREFAIAGNMTVAVGDDFGHEHRGVTLPAMLGALGRRYFNIQHRFNSFRFKVPAKEAAQAPLLDARFRFLRRMKDYNRERLPCFMPAISSLQVV